MQNTTPAMQNATPKDANHDAARRRDAFSIPAPANYAFLAPLLPSSPR